MASTSKIEWCDSTFNPWIGCTKVSPACDSCYAAVSTPARTMNIAWGAGQPRRRTSPANWKLPLRWNREEFAECGDCGWRGPIDTLEDDTCRSCGRHERLEPARRRVFCASLADVFDNEVPGSWRADLFSLIRATPNLDWLLLTKRIGNAAAMMDEAGAWSGATADGALRNPLPNVWLGTTVCNQDEADRDIPKLLATPAAVRFLSIEPMLGPINLRWQPYAHQATGETYRQYLERQGAVNHLEALRKIDWVIAGGESGTSARPMHPEWLRAMRDQCAAAGVPFLFKQWGEWAPADEMASEFQEHYDVQGLTSGASVRVGKKAAGRTLDDVEHTAFPRR